MPATPKLSVTCAELDYLRHHADQLLAELHAARRDMRTHEEIVIAAMRAAGVVELLSGRAVYYLTPGPEDQPELSVRIVPSVHDLDDPDWIATADDAHGPLSAVA